MKTHLLFLLLSPLLTLTKGQEDIYYAFKTQLDWPDEQPNLSTLYDGQDSIYIFGVDNSTILKYSLCNDSLQEVATFPEEGIFGGGAHIDPEGNIIYVPGNYFGGGSIYKIHPSDNFVETVAFHDFDIFTSYLGGDPLTGNILTYTNAFFDLVPAPANISVFDVETSKSSVIMALTFPNKVMNPVSDGNGVYHRFYLRLVNLSQHPSEKRRK